MSERRTQTRLGDADHSAMDVPTNQNVSAAGGKEYPPTNSSVSRFALEFAGNSRSCAVRQSGSGR